MNQLVKFETLDTSFVNLGALIRHLRQRNFVGRVKVMLEGYEADVFLHGAEEPTIWEKNHTTGRGAQGKDAMERLLVRARDPGGVITIYEDPGEASANQSASTSTETRVMHETLDSLPSNAAPAAPVIRQDWETLLAASGELIAAIERAVNSVHEDFDSHFRSALTAIADDYPFLDPTAGIFQFRNGQVHLRKRPNGDDFISSVTESLRRVVNKLVGNSGERFRERVAVELVVVARRKEDAFAEFTPHLDRIAGTRVL